MANLDGRTALITGGSKGIGYGIAEALVREGMHVVITARNEEEVTAAAEQLGGMGAGRALGVPCDVRDLGQQQAVAERMLSEFGSIDVVIANAGVGGYAPVDEMTPEMWNSIIETNLTGVFNTVHATVGALKKSEGYLITIASLAGGSAYNASKFGLVGFTQAAMLDLRRHRIKVSTIMPGSVSTWFNDSEPSSEEAWKIQPEDIGEMVVYLLKVPARTLPSKIEVRPSVPPSAT